MNCLQCEERLSDYLEGALDIQEAGAVQLHVAACASCNGLLAGIRDVIAWGRTFPIQEPSEWLAVRIVANTPTVVHETWLDALKGMGRWLIEPRTAMAIFTATMMLGWLGSVVEVNVPVREVVQNPSSIYYRAEGFLNRAYGDAVQRYYTTPLVTQIQFQLERLREIS